MKNLLFLSMLIFSEFVVAETIYLTSLQWPPYSGEALTKQGTSVAIAKAAFKAEGYDLVVDFFPWSRAVKIASNADSKYIGYFPEYKFETTAFIFSDPMGISPLGLLQKSSNPITFSTVKDLKNKRIGVVQDYINTKELDDLIADGVIQADAVQSDVINVKKVGTDRLDAAVIDANVLEYLIQTDESLSDIKHNVEMNQQLLEYKKLYIAFRNDDKGRKWQEIYNRGLAKIDLANMLKKVQR